MAAKKSDICRIEISWLEHGLGLTPPQYQSAGAAGVDLAAAIAPENPILIKPGKRHLVPTGFCMALPQGFEAQIRPRSGLALKHGVTILNAPGTIDSDYRGEVHVLLINLGENDFEIERGMRIAQMVIAPVTIARFSPASELPTSERGKKGFGSTGYVSD